MVTSGRQADQRFEPEEFLYRRVPPEQWEAWDDDIELDAIELPDMSVVRGKYAHPEWARFQGDEYKYADWGVIGFRVQNIPSPLQHLGVFICTFRAVHAPLRRNFPHSEVQAFEDEMHIDAPSKLDFNLHLRWREHLLRSIKKLIGPGAVVEIRQEAPVAA
jgi:hypothetical protein